MGITSWDLGGSGFSSPEPVRTPRLTIRCEYPDTDLPPTEVTFGLSLAVKTWNPAEIPDDTLIYVPGFGETMTGALLFGEPTTADRLQTEETGRWPVRPAALPPS